MNPEKGYLPSKEQLVIAAKVNRICELNPGEKAPFPLVSDAQDIINALDKRTENSTGRLKVLRGISNNKSFAGETEHGTVSTQDNGIEIKEYKRGINEYKIGGYVAVKNEHPGSKNIKYITFEPFMGRETNFAFNYFPDKTSILYYKGKVISIFKLYQKPKIFRLFRISFVRLPQPDYEFIWQRRKSEGIPKKKLLYKK